MADIADLEIIAHKSNYYTTDVALRSYGVPLDPKGICLHTTESRGLSSQWSASNADANASWDYEVLRDGRIVRNVPLGCTAWTQGVRFGGSLDTGWRPSWWTPAMGSYNQCMVGIEVQGVASDLPETMPSKQLEALARLVRWVSDYYGFPLQRNRLVGHEQLATNKTDPTPYVSIDRVYSAAVELAKANEAEVASVAKLQSRVDKLEHRVIELEGRLADAASGLLGEE